MSSVPEMNSTPLTPRVLVVDDERYVREIVRRWLERVGYECTCAESVGAACEILQQQTFDIVTSDISMPGQSGIELLRTIKENYPETAVLMLTANADTRLAIQALTLGAYGYLLKPVEQEELLCQIERALEHRRLVVENRAYTNLLEWKVREQTRHIRLAHEETIQRLVTACMFRDDETGGHIKRTGLSSALVAQAAGWSTEMVELIQLAAPMHDVGKVGIPDSILRKPGKLTTEEFKIMQQHTVIGADMLSGSLSPVLQMAEQIAHFHHERWDGTGYPNRLAGEDIPKAARILAIIDVYDALTHDRVYRRALPEEQVLQIIEDGRGTHFDPSVTKAFFEALPGIRTVNVYELDHEFAATPEAAVPPVPWISNVPSLAGAH